MELPIPKKVQKLWDVWNLRGSVLLSLFLQVFLICFASCRQRSKNGFLLIIIWSAYLLADWIAAVAIGLITKSQGETCDHPKGNPDIYAFWASFLLLHLGGPDSITSFALEDNEFWLRHLFGLFLQVLGAFYSFFLTLPKNKLWPPTMLVFVVGIIKYAERTRAFYLASLDRFGVTALPKPDPGPDYKETAAIHSSMRSIHVPTRAGIMYIESAKVSVKGAPLDNEIEKIQLLQEAYRLFEIFKGLIVGFFVSDGDRKSSRHSFLEADFRKAFRVVEYEFNFIYQVLHTKALVARGYILRPLCFIFILGALIFFCLVEKHGFGEFEIGLTYALLVSAIILDSISLIKLAFSDWTLFVLDESWTNYIPKCILEKNRWSRLVFQYDMVSYCLDKHWRFPRFPQLYKFARLLHATDCLDKHWRFWKHYKFSHLLHATDFLDKIKIMRYSSSENVTEDLEKFIFDELKRKSENARSLEDAMEACKQRGESALLGLDTSSYIKLKWSVGEYQYAESLVLWHLATEISWRDKDRRLGDDKRVCKILSDYMFYLLLMQPTMLSSVLGGNWYVILQDTCAEAKRYFKNNKISKVENLKILLEEKPKFRPAAVKGVESKSVFFDACILAQQLRNLKDQQWKLMDQVWMELVAHAAINCRPIIHAQQPSKGGELFSFVWLLMYHFGLGTNFSEQEEIAGTKMVAVKY